MAYTLPVKDEFKAELKAEKNELKGKIEVFRKEIKGELKVLKLLIIFTMFLIVLTNKESLEFIFQILGILK